jgi:hypothetical protein
VHASSWHMACSLWHPSPKHTYTLCNSTRFILAGDVEFAEIDQPVYPLSLPSECGSSSSSECGSSFPEYWPLKAVKADRVWAKVPVFGGVALQGAVLDTVRECCEECYPFMLCCCWCSTCYSSCIACRGCQELD